MIIPSFSKLHKIRVFLYGIMLSQNILARPPFKNVRTILNYGQDINLKQINTINVQCQEKRCKIKIHTINFTMTLGTISNNRSKYIHKRSENTALFHNLMITIFFSYFHIVISIVMISSYTIINKIYIFIF